MNSLKDINMSLTDNSYMKIGKHAGKKLEDIPDDYLIWLYAELAKKKKLFGYERQLWDYIQDNLDSLEP